MSSVTEVEPIKQKRQPLGAMANIPPRRLDFVFSPAKTTRYYYDNNAFKSSFLTALSSLFPHGESFFVQSVRHYREQIIDPLMKAQVAGFIGQEAMHSKEHIAFNKMATEQGYPVDKLDHDVGMLLKAAQKLTPNVVQLAATVCLEHYTAIIAEMLLSDPDVQKSFSDETRPLWLWHALEENEHKNVAFDVYQKVSGNYAVRAGTMIPTTIIFFAVAFWFHARMLAADSQLLNLRQNWQGFKYFWGGRNGVFSRLLPKYLDFFKPGFHPSQHDTDALLADWRERLFGKEGSLTSQVKHPGRHSSH
jgi:predicted metal-dependent hydrolase